MSVLSKLTLFYHSPVVYSCCRQQRRSFGLKRMGTKQSFSLERQFSVDGQEWQRQKAKHDDLRALFVRLGISPTFSMRLTTVRKMEPRHPRTLRSPVLSSSNVRIICSSFIKRSTPN